MPVAVLAAGPALGPVLAHGLGAEVVAGPAAVSEGVRGVVIVVGADPVPAALSSSVVAVVDFLVNRGAPAMVGEPIVVDGGTGDHRSSARERSGGGRAALGSFPATRP